MIFDILNAREQQSICQHKRQTQCSTDINSLCGQSFRNS